MTKKITFFITILLFSHASITGQILFDWESAIDHGDTVTQTIGGITVSTDFLAPDIYNVGSSLGSSGNSVLSFVAQNKLSFSFSEPVIVNSILTFGGSFQEIEYTYTPTGGTNSPVVITMLNRTANVILNWTDVTSFTITSTVDNLFAFDNLLINDVSLAVDHQILPQITIYPSPVEDVLNLKNIIGLKNIRVFNMLGQLVVQTKEETIDFSKLPSGIYTLQINTDIGTQTKKIIKK